MSKVQFEKNDKNLIILAILILIVTPFTSDSYTPSLPEITKAFNSSPVIMQYTMTFYLLGVSFSQLIYGPLSDRFGRRVIILIGFIIAFIGSLFCIFAFSAKSLIIARLILGSGAGVCNSVFRAVIHDRFEGKKMAIVGTYTGMFYTFVFAFAPTVGGYIEYYLGWRANFVFVAFVIATIFTILYLYLPETHQSPDPTAIRMRNIIKNYFSILRQYRFIGYAIIAGFAFSGLIAYFTAGPFLMINKLHLTPVAFGWLSIGLAAGIFLGQYLNARLIHQFGISSLLLLGVSLMVISSTLMLLFALFGFFDAYVVIGPFIIYSIAAGLVFANAMTEAFRFINSMAGSAGALYGFIQILCGSLTSIIIAQLHENSQMPLACVLTGLAVMAMILYWLANSDVKTSPPLSLS